MDLPEYLEMVAARIRKAAADRDRVEALRILRILQGAVANAIDQVEAAV